jgi:hypothetical protein
MRQHWFLRALLAGTVGLGIVAGLARGETPVPPLAGSGGGTVVTSVPEGATWSGDMSTGSSCGCAGGGGGEVGSGEGHHFLHHSHIANWLHNNCGCWAQHNTFGCGSCKSEFNFVFGSCRTFFGEPCQHGAPPSPIPPPLPGYVPGMPIPGQIGYGPPITPPGGANPWDYSAVPSSRIMPSPGAPPVAPGATGYQFMPGGYR